jgi:putative 4-mercaptohistidine N1-methyltranferase
MSDNPYESSKLLGEYLLFHYGKDAEILPWADGPVDALAFTKRTIEYLIDKPQFNESGKALDVGCAVGASSFVLGKYFGNVLGVDYSQSFIDAANQLQEGNFLDYTYIEEGDAFSKAKAIPVSHKGKVSFEVGDATCLPDHMSGFDLVHAANLICRLPSPKSFLDRLPNLVKKGGQLLLATPFTWLEEFTPQNEWIGGSGNSKEELKEYLGSWFSLEYEEDLPFLIREHRRKYQYSISWGTRWRRL